MRKLLVSLLLAVPLLSSCEKDHPPLPVSFGVGKLVLSAPVFVADARGFFRQHGVVPHLSYFTSGREALQSVLAAKNDLATAADFPIAKAAFEGRDVVLLATMATSRKESKVVARHRPTSAADIRGWVIGCTPDTTSDYFLDEFLIMNLVPRDAVEVVPLRPEEMVDKLARGEVDAVSTWEAIASACLKRLGPAAAVMTLDTHSVFWNLASRKTAATVPAEAVLQALVEAVRYIKENPADAIAITARYLGEDPRTLQRVWHNYDFDLSLSQGLLLTLENEGRWLSGRTGKSTRLMNEVIRQETLQRVRPAAVTVIAR